ncbi:hypothetical protein MIND_00890300 [Mycena indigotica]|uniref:Uncharacterized protein n=1 Tax=Mycena indigotica TaxID=2126181 RepID=A0A8H6SGY5_9AGAR|nr:uncharacterized protein MIND_00890300 [Mycena indigotica]KAF7299405.1 hypothetical protein MIND_00890300 [Mycena indigotica]
MALNSAAWQLGLPKQATDLLDQNFESMCRFVAPDWEIPAWVPDTTLPQEQFQFFRDLKIPSVPNGPNFLFHELGDYGHDPDMKSRIENIFRPKATTCLINASGTGKTRHSLEALCLEWGFYLCFKDKSLDIGSGDMNDIERRLRTKKTFTPVLPPRSDETYTTKLDDNRELVDDSFYHVILARFLIFKLFLTAIVATGRPITRADKKRWTLLQAHPDFLEGTLDIFRSLASILDSPTLDETVRKQRSAMTGADCNVIYNRLSIETREFISKHYERDASEAKINPKPDRFYFVVDEAQLAARILDRAFASARPNPQGNFDLRPLLRELIAILRNLSLDEHGAVITGTGLDIELIQDALGSILLKADVEGDLRSDTGGFYEDKAMHKAYITRFMPPDLMRTRDGEHFVQRMTKWLAGRYRTTAAFLLYFLRNGGQNPQLLLDTWIHFQTNFTPTDGPTIRNFLPADPEATNRMLNQLQYNRIETNSEMLTLFTRAVHHSFIRSQINTTMSKFARKFVEYGFARFRDGKCSTSRIYEPLIILSAMSRMEVTCNQRRINPISPGQLLVSHTELDVGDKDGANNNGFESYVGLALADTLGEFIPLDKVFVFHKKYRPKWANKRARLVTVQQDDPSAALTVHEVSWSRGRVPGGHLGHNCNLDETLQWMQHQDPLQAPICYPDKNMGPDILCKLQFEDETFLWVAVQCKNYTGGIKQNDLPRNIAQKARKAIATVTPAHFWMSQTQEGELRPYCYSSQPKLRETTARALASLSPPTLSTRKSNRAHPINLDDHSFPLLRVLAVFPTAVDLERPGISSDNVLKDAGQHPICTINWDYMGTKDKRQFVRAMDDDYEEKPDVGAKAKQKTTRKAKTSAPLKRKKAPSSKTPKRKKQKRSKTPTDSDTEMSDGSLFSGSLPPLSESDDSDPDDDMDVDRTSQDTDVELEPDDELDGMALGFKSSLSMAL